MHLVDASNPAEGQILPDNFYELFALSRFYTGAVKPENHRIPEDALNALTLSEYGAAKSTALKTQFGSFSQAEIKQALFRDFFHEQPYFDFSKSSPIPLRKFLSDAIAESILKYPWIYGTILYRAANKLFPQIQENLDPADTDRLLNETPQGVFQMRNLVAGPFGILQSAQSRHLPPTLTVPLWHCSDPECSAVHDGKLKSNKTDLTRILKALDTDNRSTPLKRWDKAYAEKREDADHYDVSYPGAMCDLLGGGFSDRELKDLIKSLLRRRKGLADLLSTQHIASRMKAGIDNFTDKLTINQCLQLALVCDDKSIIEELEKLILAKIINVPPSETRSSQQRSGWFNVGCQATSYGIRFFAPGAGMPSAKLKALLTKLYPNDNTGELDWRLRFIEGSFLAKRLDNYVDQSDPRTVVQDQILVSGQALEHTFSLLGGHFELPKSKPDEQICVERIMWKLGYTVPRFPITYGNLDNSLEKFRQTTLALTSRWTEAQSEVRGDAVNFFVALENFLNDSLSFSTWALLSDHYSETKFIFSLRDGHEVLSNSLSGSGEDIKYDADGRNTLYPLCRGFRLLAERCRTIISSPERYIRPESQYPGYAGHTSLSPFPFVHTKLILDIAAESRDVILSNLVSVTADLEKSKIAGLRNSIEHSRNEFPDPATILSALEVASSTIDRLLKLGLAPATYVISEHQQDKWGRVSTIYQNYRNDTVRMPFRAKALISTIPQSPVYAIFSPAISLANNQETMRFSLREDSDYADLWDGYPIRPNRRNVKKQDGPPAQN